MVLCSTCPARRSLQTCVLAPRRHEWSKIPYFTNRSVDACSYYLYNRTYLHYNYYCKHENLKELFDFRINDFHVTEYAHKTQLQFIIGFSLVLLCTKTRNSTVLWAFKSGSFQTFKWNVDVSALFVYLWSTRDMNKMWIKINIIIFEQF